MSTPCSDEDDITIITLPSYSQMTDDVDGDLRGLYPARTLQPAPVPQEFQIYSNGHERSPRPAESEHALNVAYTTLKHRYNDLQQKHFELERRVQSQRQMDGFDCIDGRVPSGIQTEWDRTSPGPARPAGDGFTAHGTRQVPEMELEQQNKILQIKIASLEKELWDKNSECEAVKAKLKDMEEICQQITSANGAGQYQKQQHAPEVAGEDGDEETEESETTNELTEKNAAMMRHIISELSLSRQTIEDQQRMIEALQQSRAVASRPAFSSTRSPDGHEVSKSQGRAKSKSCLEESHRIEAVQCTEGRAGAAAPCHSRPLDSKALLSRETELFRPVGHAKGADAGSVERGRVMRANTRPSSVSAPLLIHQTPVLKQRSLSSSMEPLVDSPYRDLSQPDFHPHIESDSVDSAAMIPDRYDVFGRPNQDKKFEPSAVIPANIFSDNADDLYGNDMDSKRLELRRRQSNCEGSNESDHRYEPLRQSWPVSVPRHQSPDDSNRYQLGTRSHAPRPLNIDRNVEEPVHSRSYDNTRNVNLLADPSPASGSVATAVSNQNYGVLNNDPLAATKPVPKHNIFQEGSDLTVRLPPAGQLQHSQEPKTCPVCNQSFPAAFAQSDFEEHVVVCLNSSSGENSPTGGDRLCPLCHRHFSNSIPQIEFEEHVNGHFDDFEVLPRSAVVPSERDNFGSPEPSGY